MADSTIYVKPTSKAENRVILFEQDARHPGGEAFLRGYVDESAADVKEVFPTKRVRDAIHEGYLVETTKAGKEKAS